MTGSPKASPLLPNHQYKGGTFAHMHRHNSTSHMTPNQLAYMEFLQTAVWGMLRDKCLERDNHRCTKCGSKLNVQAHHLRYRKTWIDTELEDLTALCQACHRQAHGIREPYAPRKKRAQKPEGALKVTGFINKRLKENWKQMGKIPIV